MARSAALLLAVILTIDACGMPASPSLPPPPAAATLNGRVTSVALPAMSRLVVHVCPESTGDCDRWLYLTADGEFRIELAPGRYAVAVFLETRSGLVPLTSEAATLLADRTSVVDLVVIAIQSFSST